MADTLDKIVTFFRVSPAQHVVALGMSTPAAILCAYVSIENYSQGDIDELVTNTLIALANTGFLLFLEYSAIGKMQEYGKVKSALEEHGWDERIIEPKSHTWCQRNIAQVASKDSGFGNKTREYLKDKGYRWYNFIPDV